MTITQSSTTRLVAFAAGVAVAFALLLGASAPVRAAALSQTQVQSILNLLSSFGADAATIANVNSALNGQATTGTTGGTTVSTGGVCPFTWSRNLQVGSTGADVKALQQFLNLSASTQIAATGAGSPGMETSTFGPATKKAVTAFQTANGISAVGNVGPMTRAKLNSLCTGTTGGTTTGGTTTGGTTTGGTTTSGTATVSAGTQPVNAIAPQGASRVPYTAFTVTAGASAVTVNNVTVQRQGPSLDTDFAGVILVDATTGMQLGTSRVLDANHSAIIGTPVTIAAGTSKTFWVEGNIAPVNGTIPGSGDVASFAVTAVNTGSTVSGSLPITGASNTINTALTIGTASIQSSSYDPNSASSQPIGTTAYRFTGVRVQAGSAEDVSFKSITWYNSGSTSGVQNVVTVVNGTSYPATVDSTGRYYSTVFPSAIVIPKGQTIDLYVQGDLGANTTANTYAEFDIYRNTDIYLVGNTYGFGITPTNGNQSAITPTYDSTSSHKTIFVSGTNPTPWIQGSTVTVTAGTFSTIQNASSVGAQNIAVNVPNQPLGGFSTNLTGEAIQAQSIKVHFTTSAKLAVLQNVSLVNESGSVVAGPYNATCDDATSYSTNGYCNSYTQYVTFSGATAFPTGSHTYTLEGQVQTQTGINGATIQADTNPKTDWTNVTGQTTGNNVAIGVTDFTMNTMTVQAATLVVSNGSSPTSQTIVAGGQNIKFATINLDASQSGEDVRMSSVPLQVVLANYATTSDLSNCQLWNGTTALNTGSRVVNSTQISSTVPPPGAGTYHVTFSFDNALTVPKGTVLGLGLTCNVTSSASANATYTWGAEATTMSLFSATGAVSGSTVSVTTPGGTAPTMTASTGATLAASTDSSAPGYSVAAGGTTGLTVNVIKLRATNEAVNLQKLGLTLVGNTGDVAQAYIYAGNNVLTTAGAAVAPGTLLGTVVFSGAATATSTLSTSVQLPVNTDATFVIKADLAAIGTSQPGTEGDLVQVNYNSSRGVGANSGKTIDGVTGAVTSQGVRVFKSFPTIALGTGLASGGVSDGNLMRFTVTANSQGSIGLDRFVFNLTSGGVTSIANVNLYAYTDAGYSQPANTGTTGGLVGTTQWTTGTAGTATTTLAIAPLQVSAGQTLYFQLTSTVSPTGATYNINTKLLGDSTAPTTGVTNITNLLPGGSTASNFVWSPNATSTSATTTGQVGSGDWTNAAGISGLSSVGLNQNRTQ